MDQVELRTKINWFWLLPGIAFFLVLTAICGIFIPSTYAQESLSMTTRMVGQDFLNLLFVAPLLIASAILSQKGSKPALLVLFGILLYIAYSYVNYAFFMYFSWLFIPYVATLGLSVYAIIYGAKSLNFEAVKSSFSEKAPLKNISILLTVVGALFGLLWLKDIFGFLISGVTPQIIVDSGLPTNAAYVLDLAFLVPALFIIAYTIKKRESFGIVAAAPLLTFVVLISLNIIITAVAMSVKEISNGFVSAIPTIVAMSLIILASLVLLINLLDSLNQPAAQTSVDQGL